MLFLAVTLPAVAVVIAMHAMGLSLGVTLVWALGWGLIVRASPWFGRPEGYQLNLLVGWALGEIVNTVLWRRTPGL